MLLIRRSLEFLSLSATRTRTLKTNFLWNAAGSAVFALCQWGILVVFAKLGSPTLVGQLVYGLALIAPVFVVSGLQLRSIQATDADNRHTLGQYLGLRALTTVAALMLRFLLRLSCGRPETNRLSSSCSGRFQRPSTQAVMLSTASFSNPNGWTTWEFPSSYVASWPSLVSPFYSGPATRPHLRWQVWWPAGARYSFFSTSRWRERLLRQREHQPHTSGTMAETLRLVFDRQQLTPLCLEAAPLGACRFSARDSGTDSTVCGSGIAAYP